MEKKIFWQKIGKSMCRKIRKDDYHRNARTGLEKARQARGLEMDKAATVWGRENV
jgi:hypothetical protein